MSNAPKKGSGNSLKSTKSLPPPNIIPNASTTTAIIEDKPKFEIKTFAQILAEKKRLAALASNSNTSGTNNTEHSENEEKDKVDIKDNKEVKEIKETKDKVVESHVKEMEIDVCFILFLQFILYFIYCDFEFFID